MPLIVLMALCIWASKVEPGSTGHFVLVVAAILAAVWAWLRHAPRQVDLLLALDVHEGHAPAPSSNAQRS